MNSEGLLNNKKSVPKEFNSVASKYDVATGLSQGYQNDLNLSASRMNLNGNEYIADLCCGTGKSTKACLNHLPEGKILAIDNSEEMLDVAIEKLNNQNIQFELQDVMKIVYADETFDAIFMAYGIRNMPDYDKCLKNLYRMLKPNGVLCMHEYSVNKNIFAQLYWKVLGYGIIIPISTALSGSSKIYKYLVKSVLKFPAPEEFIKIVKQNGFKNVERLPMPSWRKPILHTFLAYKK